MGACANISCSTGNDYSENLVGTSPFIAHLSWLLDYEQYVGGPRTTKPYPIMDAVKSWMGEACESYIYRYINWLMCSSIAEFDCSLLEKP